MPLSATQTATVSDETREPGPAIATEDPRWKQVEKLACRLSVEVRVPGFTLKDLLNLRPQSILRSHLVTSASPPLQVNGELVAWCDFEVLGSRLAVRLTELA